MKRNQDRNPDKSPSQSPAPVSDSRLSPDNLTRSPSLSSGSNSLLAQEAGRPPAEEGLPPKLSDKGAADRLESAARPLRDEEEDKTEAYPKTERDSLPRKLSDKEVGFKDRSEDETVPKKLFGDEIELSPERQKEQAAYLNEGLTKPFSQGGDLYGARLDGRDLKGGQFANADLRNGSLAGADLSGADLRNADLSGADLSGADLQGANLQGANLNGALIAGANLQGATGTKYDGQGNLTVDKAIKLPRLDLSA